MRLVKYLQNFLLFLLIIAVPPLTLSINLIPYFWYIFFVFAIMSLSIHLVTFWGIMTSNKATVRTFLGGTSLKFLVWMVFIFFYLRKKQRKQRHIYTGFFLPVFLKYGV